MQDETASASGDPGDGAVDDFRRLIDIGTALSGVGDPQELMARILMEAKAITAAEAGTLYLRPDDDAADRLDFAILSNDVLGIFCGDGAGESLRLPALPLHDPHSGAANHSNVATHAALSGRTVCVEDAYHQENFDFSGTKAFDARTGYRSISFLTVPLKNHRGDVIGVLQLINARPDGVVGPFDPGKVPLVEALASLAAVTLDNKLLIEQQKKLLESFLQVIARAIDAKSPHTSAHCQRVPVLTELIVQAAAASTTGPLAMFDLTREQWFELHVAAWMHDCGKLTTPDYILDKSTKLMGVSDGIETLALRIEVLKRDAEIALLRDRTLSPEAVEAALAEACAAFDDDLAFLRRINRGAEAMADADLERLARIAARSFGAGTLISPAERENLAVRRGTLTDAERQIMRDHIVATIDMLDALPFPRNLRRVPEYAGGHHERVDGKGYPKGLRGADMSVPARAMAIADVFEALTAKERPYKAPMPLSQAFAILAEMSRNGHLDPMLWAVFLRSGTWRDYARDHLLADQIDVEDIAPYL